MSLLIHYDIFFSLYYLKLLRLIYWPWHRINEYKNLNMITECGMSQLVAVLKTGASGMIAYRFQTKEGQWQWLQTSSRLVYKNSKPDFVISTHRPLMWVSRRQHTLVSVALQPIHPLSLDIQCRSSYREKLLMFPAYHDYFQSFSRDLNYMLKLLALLLLIIFSPFLKKCHFTVRKKKHNRNAFS